MNLYKYLVYCKASLLFVPRRHIYILYMIYAHSSSVWLKKQLQILLFNCASVLSSFSSPKQRVVV